MSESIAEQEMKNEAEKPKRGRRYQPKYGSFKEAAQAKADKARDKQLEEMPKPTRAVMNKLTTDGDLVDIWERRLVNPDHRDSVKVRISTPGMELRWINLKNPGRYHRARYEQGWVPVHKSELVDEREIADSSYTSEGHVCRGEKQAEMLMKMPTAIFRQIQERRAALNLESYKKLREQMGSAGFDHFKGKYGGSAGDQAAEVASQFRGQIKFGTEKVSETEVFE